MEDNMTHELVSLFEQCMIFWPLGLLFAETLVFDQLLESHEQFSHKNKKNKTKEL